MSISRSFHSDRQTHTIGWLLNSDHRLSIMSIFKLTNFLCLIVSRPYVSPALRSLTSDAANCPGVYRLSSGLVQLAVVWCAGERAEEGSVCAERCRSSAHQHRAPWPHHTGVASTTLAASSETSGVQDRLPCSPATGFKSADVPHCRHSTRLRSSSNWTLAVPRTQQLRRQKLCCCGTTPVEQFTD